MRKAILPLYLMVLTMAFAQMASAADLYVATNLNGDGSSWATATNSIQGAIDAIDGTYVTNTVWVSNGVYEVGGGGVTNYPPGTVLTNRVAIYKAITVRSANNDPMNTVIMGTWASDGNTNGTDAVRCVYMTNGSSLIGFMLTNGATLAAGANDDKYGGGVWCQSTSLTISNCVIAGNSANSYGGGSYNGILYNCTLTGNSAFSGGGGFQVTLRDCILTGNKATSAGGGVYQTSLYNCQLTQNWSGNVGGGTAYATLYNCSLIGNWTVQQGGGAYDGTLYNCTLTSNRTINSHGGGSYTSRHVNCIVYFNSAGTANSNYYNARYFTNSCTAPDAGGVGNIADDPMFIDMSTANYRLSNNSPCINKGINFSWMTDSSDLRSKDLDGRTRIRYGTVDMGAYEAIYEGTFYSIP